jgi:phage terminase small subunit
LRKPTAIRQLEGLRSHRPLPKNEPQPRVGAQPPSWLPLAARKEWDVLAPMLLRLGVLTETDAEACAELCTGRALLHKQAQEGKWSTELWRAVQAMEARFGLTPADRARIEVKPPGEDDGW